MPSGRLTASSVVQPEKAEAPTLVSVSGRSMPTSFEQP